MAKTINSLTGKIKFLKECIIMKYFLDGKPLSTFITQYLNIFISIPNFLSMTVDPPKISRNLFRGRIESIQSAGKKSPKVTFKTRPWLVHEIIVSE